VTLAVFSDFQCPYCSRFAAIVKDLAPEEAAKVRLVFRHLPLPMHSWARPAAEATACAQEQGDSYFWGLHDFLFDHQKEITRDNILQKLAEAEKSVSGFDQGKFAACVIERKTAAQVERDISFAQEHGINATPTVFLNGQQTQIVVAERRIRREAVRLPRARQGTSDKSRGRAWVGANCPGPRAASGCRRAISHTQHLQRRLPRSSGHQVGRSAYSEPLPRASRSCSSSPPQRRPILSVFPLSGGQEFAYLLAVVTQRSLPRGAPCGRRVHRIESRRLTIELKCVDRLASAHMAQFPNYLRASALALPAELSEAQS
jgi:hypothetical protein